MRIKLIFLAGLAVLLTAGTASGQQPAPAYGVLRTNISVHDPVMIRQDSLFYIFCTGNGVSMFSSKDMINWKQEKPVFAEAPQWARDFIKTFRGNSLWAPDISYHNGLYYLYYSASAFGKNTSCIGVATNKTLHTDDPAYAWTDHGKVVQSIPGKTNWNAIDPNLVTDIKGRPYLAFGSFWNGLQLAKLTGDRLHLAQPVESIVTIASRKKDPGVKENLPSVDNNPVDAGGNAIEAPFIFKRGKYYYLFASIDYCCKGINSTYKMIVGRSKEISGPYLDKTGVSMAKGGGTLVLEGDKNWYGVGHNGVSSFDKTDYLVFHGYSAADNGRSKLRIEKITWEKGWPAVQPRTAN
ncbi:arabinan endo-1,5-alpha-L-arabinosidase [Hufsiella ginkgonis]|uniref:Family 43 glycosylhydrolase n=1 Tax=Hufsiella ginkgonis TaxID=2695274 RepID=A0A7K1Y188_9SPHI|nr:arabinan endo-1,5-alpha-L-arabinosidase [Hufsiella ginkgonis]MXV17015.1 family 43 glycosylhydrolase [Hufsiella ginkgonis]